MSRRTAIPCLVTLLPKLSGSAAAILLILGVATDAWGQDSSLEKLFHDAQAASRQNNYAQAEKLYRQILDADPEILPARVNLGLACYWQHKSREALTEFHKALQASPREFSALLFSGLAYLDLTDYDHAQAALEKAGQVNDKDSLLFWALGSLAMMHNDARAAVQPLERCVALAPDNVRCVWLLGSACAILAYREHQEPAVQAEYEARVESGLHWMEQHEPNTALLHVFKGDVLAARKRTHEALTEYQWALKIDTQWPDIHLLTGSLLRMLGRWDEAQAELKRQLQDRPNDSRAMTEMGSLYCDSWNYDEAVTLLKQALARDSNNYEANYQLGRSYLALEKYPLAIPFLERATKLKPEESSSYYLLYRAYRTIKQPEKAAEALKQFKRLKALGS